VAELEKLMGVSAADIEKIMGVAKADIEKVMGVEVVSMTSYQGNRAVAMGGYDTNEDRGSTGSYATNRLDEIEYKAMASDGNTLLFGEIASRPNVTDAAMTGSDTRAVAMGGYYNSDSEATVRNDMDYITIANTGNSTDFGDITVAREDGAGVGNGIRGVCCAGYTASAFSNVMDYITVGSTGNATDFGDATRAVAPQGSAGNAHTTTGIFQMAYDGDYTNLDFNYITIASTGNAGDFGDWSAAIASTAAIGLIESKSVWGGGYTSGAGGVWSTMEYVNPNSLGNTTSQGDLGSAAHTSAGKFTNGTRGEMWGGGSNSYVNVQKLTIASSADASHAGEVREGARTNWDGWTGD